MFVCYFLDTLDRASYRRYIGSCPLLFAVVNEQPEVTTEAHVIQTSPGAHSRPASTLSKNESASVYTQSTDSLSEYSILNLVYITCSFVTVHADR